MCIWIRTVTLMQPSIWSEHNAEILRDAYSNSNLLPRLVTRLLLTRKHPLCSNVLEPRRGNGNHDSQDEVNREYGAKNEFSLNKFVGSLNLNAYCTCNRWDRPRIDVSWGQKCWTAQISAAEHIEGSARRQQYRTTMASTLKTSQGHFYATVKGDNQNLNVRT